MRFPKIFPVLISAVLLLIAVSPVYGQTITYSLLGHEREIGPLEQSLYTYQWSALGRSTVGPLASQSETVAQEQPSIVWPIVGGAVGGAIGTTVGFGIASLIFKKREVETFSEAIEKALLALIIVAGLETTGVAVGVHRGNKRLGSFGPDLLASLVGLNLGAPVSDWLFDETGIQLATIFIMQLSFTVLVERLTAAKNLRARRP